jgi:hypothetical protein
MSRKKAVKGAGSRSTHKKKLLRRQARFPAVEVEPDFTEVPPEALPAADLGAAIPANLGGDAQVRAANAEVTAGLPDVGRTEDQAGGIGQLVAERNLLWLVGPARHPRSAIVGRALSESGALTEASAQTYWRICDTIRRRGQHHLRNELLEVLRDYDLDTRGGARRLAGLLGSAITYLDAVNPAVIQLARRQGIYLVGRGPVLFEGWPEWDRRDEAPQPPRRSGREQQTPTGPDAPAPGTAPPRRRLMPLEPSDE